MSMRILIVDDEIRGNKCKKMIQFLKENNIAFDYVETLDMAKLAIENGEYSGIVTDRNFPERLGAEVKGWEGKKLVGIVERNKKIPILVFSAMLGEIKSPVVYSTMRFWDKELFQDFIEFIRNMV